LAKKALQHAEELAKTCGAENILFQVIPLMPTYGAPDLMRPVIVDEKQKEAAEMDLTMLAEEMRTRGYKATATVRIGQQVAAEIIDFAKERGVDLIVICTHGYSGITGWALGSVARKLLTRAETPILLIHSNR